MGSRAPHRTSARQTRASRDAALALCCLAPLAGEARARTPIAPVQAAADPAFVELVAPRAWIYVDEATSILLRVGVEREFAETQLVQPFARQLDVPVQVHAPWPEAVQPQTSGPSRTEPPGTAHASIALDDGVATARRLPDVVRDGHAFLVLELERPLRAPRAARLVFEAPSVRLTRALRFEHDALGQRVPAELSTQLVAGRALELEVRELPQAGRPADFGGAIGEFELESELSTRDWELGTSVRLVLRIRGHGNFESFEAPQLDRWEAIHVLGRLEERTSDARVVNYDLRARDAALESVPAIEFPYFDPRDAGTYRVARTDSIPIRVRAPVAARASEGVEHSDESQPGPPPRLAFVLAIAVAIVAAISVAWRARRAR